MQRRSLAGLRAALMIASVGAGMDVLAQSVPLRSAGSGNNRRPHQPRRDTALQREIADHNAEVDRLKAEKRDRRRNRGSAPGGA